MSEAASTCGVSRASVYRWRERSVRFARQWDDAVDDGADLLESEAWRRAVKGTVRPVFARGVQVGEVRQYSDRLLMFLLQAKRPRVYRAHAVPGIRQSEIPEDLGRRVNAARERVRNAPPPPPREVPARPIEGRPPDPPARKDDDDPPSSSAAFRARYGRYPTGFEVMKLGIKCFQAADRQVTGDHAARHEHSSSPSPQDPTVLQTNDEYLPRSDSEGEGGAQRRMGKGHPPDAAVCSPPPSALRAPSPLAGKVSMRSGKSGVADKKDGKFGLGRTLARLCRVGIDAVLGQPRAGESIDGVSHLSHAVHRMPILRAFWRNDRDPAQRPIETKRAPAAAFRPPTCLIPGLFGRHSASTAMPA